MFIVLTSATSFRYTTCATFCKLETHDFPYFISFTIRLSITSMFSPPTDTTNCESDSKLRALKFDPLSFSKTSRKCLPACSGFLLACWLASALQIFLTCLNFPQLLQLLISPQIGYLQVKSCMHKKFLSLLFPL